MLRSIKKLVPKELFGLYHLSLAWVGNILYSSPSKNLFLIGVTGTKGKTTTSYFIFQMLEKTGNAPVALTSTTFFAIGDDIKSNRTKMGMPGRFFLSAFLNEAVKKSAKYAVVETTSEGIAQHRQRFLNYNVVVFTSLSPEHIERHGSFTAYREAKEKLFEQCQETHILNLNDKHVEHFLKYPAEQKWGVILDQKIPKSFVGKGHILFLLEGTTAAPNKLNIKEWKISNGKKELVYQANIVLPFPGKFNAMNLLLALSATRAAGVTFNKIIGIIPRLTLPPGRMQELEIKGVSYRIFLDYAHEPLSLKSALESCRELLLPKGNNLICLTGAQGGGRDKWKRKVMGSVAASLCDYVIIGTEDPYEEDPEKINQEVLEGVLSNKKFQELKNCWKFSDRSEAIKKALDLTNPGDIVIICGKGGEKFMCVGNEKIPWDEEEKVRKIIDSSK